MNGEEQLQWEARWGLPAAIAAFAAGVMLLLSGLLFVPENRDGIEPYSDFLISVHEQSGAYLVSGLLGAVGSLLLIGVFLYLFRASVARGAAVPRWFLYLVVGAPVIYAISSVWLIISAIDFADEFTGGDPIRGDKGEDRARDIGDSGPVLLGLSLAGTVAIAFLFVMLPLRARRVGLLTPFMGILGVVAGALIVFRGQFPGLSTVVQAFWLGALGMIYLRRWPGGPGPAWVSGRAEPWPTAAQRRGAVPMPGEEQEPTLDPTPPEPEPVPQRPKSRKRRRKR